MSDDDSEHLVSLYQNYPSGGARGRAKSSPEVSSGLEIGRALFWCGHIVALALYLPVLVLDLAGVTGSCWSGGGGEMAPCNFSSQLKIDLLLTIVLWGPLFLFLYVCGWNQREQAGSMSFFNRVFLMLSPTPFVAAVLLLVIPSFGPDMLRLRAEEISRQMRLEREAERIGASKSDEQVVHSDALGGGNRVKKLLP